ncbi:MAG: septum formation initiator family protein [Solirubrobacteraceae bacterium]
MNTEFIHKLIKKKYLIILSLFIVWMAFFDTNCLITHYQLSKELKKVNLEKKYLKETIKKEAKEYNVLVKYPSEIERIARELYYFKKNNEDLFIIESKKIEE